MRLLFALSFFLFSFFLSAQYEKGNWHLNANAGAQATSNRLGIGDLLGSSLTGGFFLEKNVMVGARLELGSLLEDDLVNTHYRLEPFVRYYLPSARMRRLRYFAEVGAGLLFENNLQTNLRGGVGAEYQLAPGILATAGLRYNTAGENRPSGLTLDFGVNLVFGDLEDGGREGIGNRRGTFMLDASIGQLTLGRLDDIGLVSGALALNGGYFLTNKLVLEGGLAFAANNVEREEGSEFISRSNRFSAQFGVRYLFREGERFQPYLSSAIRYEYVSQYYNYAASDRVIDFSGGSHSADIRAGFLHNFNERVALDFNVGYNPTLNGRLGRSGFSGGVGLKVFLGKR